MKIVDVCAATFGQVPGHNCMSCTYWHGKVEGDAAEARRSMFAEGKLKGKVALDDHGQTMGFVQYGELSAYPEFAKLHEVFGNEVLSGMWAITCIMTQKEFRGQGVSKQLLRSVVKDAAREGRAIEALGMEDADMEVISTGPAQLYRQLGFQELGRMRDEYGLNVLMRYDAR